VRHLLITLPVAILLSVVACNNNESNERNANAPAEQASDQVTSHRDAMNDALKNEDREGFVREANQALDTAERQLQTLGASTTGATRAGEKPGEKPSEAPTGSYSSNEGQQNVQARDAIRDDIRVARDDLNRIGAMPADQWKDTGREIDRKVKDIADKLDDLTG
jgi:hypothetical protein